MIKHIVMWKLKEFVDNHSKAQNAKTMKQMLEKLKDKIEEIKCMEIGIGAARSASNYDIVLSSSFNDWRDLEAYLKHPEHSGVREFVIKVSLERAVVDYESD
ncbi:MAG: Dabb family protein [Deltaproteobacteria bacterium]|nr:Dabb family protein [Deltaproteobacteria bacterium]